MAKKRYAVMREEKRSNMGQLGRCNSHNLRTRPCKNADPAKPQPVVLFGSTRLSQDVKAKIPEKRRKNAVIAVEVVLTASPDFFRNASPRQRREWVEENLRWLKEEHGGNLVQAVLHLDETTPHIHAFWVPMLDGRLNYRAISGSPRDMVAKQDRYGEAMARFGLSRGEPNSARRHAHHSNVVKQLEDANKKLEELDVVKKRLREAARAILDVADHVGSMAGQEALKTAVEALVGGERATHTTGEAGGPSVAGRGRERDGGAVGLSKGAPQVPLRPAGPRF